MATFIQLLVSGFATGAIYALIAVGFTLLWQTSQTINFAQGEFVMLPAFFILEAMYLGAPFWLAILIGIALSLVLLGVTFKLIIVDPMIKHGVLPLVISTIALSLFTKEMVKNLYSSQAQPFPALTAPYDFHIFGAVISSQSLAVLAVAISAVVALHLLLHKTRVGRTMQATAQNPTLAGILGIPVRRMVLYTFLINAVLCAIASILISPIYLAKFINGETLGIAAFLAAIIGGFNQVRGAILGGFLIGILDNLSAAYISSTYRTAPPLLILIVIIMWRPQGLLGRVEERTV
jgi:branched-chain amino acid transport system permease protein